MSKLQNTKSEQLTEQWKKGELPSGWFWVEGCRDKEIYAYTSEYLNHMYRPKNSDRIIEQVPSYEEWIALNGNMDSVMQTNQALCKKLAELKELLKECELWFTGVVGNMNDKNVGEHNRSLPISNFEYIFTVFSQKINEVLK